MLAIKKSLDRLVDVAAEKFQYAPSFPLPPVVVSPPEKSNIRITFSIFEFFSGISQHEEGAPSKPQIKKAGI